MQLQGELQEKGLQPRMYKGPSTASRSSSATRLRGIYRGLARRTFTSSSPTGAGYGLLRTQRHTLTSQLFTDPKTQSLGINVFRGANVGYLGCGRSPFFLVKTRLQSFRRRAGWDAAIITRVRGWMGQIYKADGVTGPYLEALQAAMFEPGSGSSVQLPTYFFAKRDFEHLFAWRRARCYILAGSNSKWLLLVLRYASSSKKMLGPSAVVET